MEIRRGNIISDYDDDPAKETLSFTAQIIVLKHPTQIMAGYTPVIHCHTSQVACQFSRLIQKLDRRSGLSLEENPQSVKSGDACIVELVPQRPMVCICSQNTTKIDTNALFSS